MVVVLRYVNREGEVIERFLDVQHISSTTSSSLEEVIERLFASTNLSMSKLWGRGYDGASNMKGELNGLKAKILNKYFQAFYVHCFAHQLQLVLVAVAKGIEGVAIFLNNASILVNTIGSSCKRRDSFREKQLEQIKKALDIGDLEMGRGLNQEISLIRPCDTCWNSHYGTIISIIVMYKVVVEVLEWFKDDTNQDNFGELFKLVLVLPVAATSMERAFSAMKIVKTPLCNNMGDQWLSDSMLVYIERDVFAFIDNESIMRRFHDMKPRQQQLAQADVTTEGVEREKKGSGCQGAVARALEEENGAIELWCGREKPSRQREQGMASSSSSSSAAFSRLSNLRKHLHPSHFDKGGVGSIKISPEVSDALSNGRAVVALESTIISHGMPYPKNLETAKEVEAVVRDNGAVPATVAILDGVPCIGLSMEELEKLANLGHKAQKTARRDIAHVVATRGNGATTVSATMFFASRVGIPLFVTGGIGGVHRHGEHTMDISSDLTELGRTPVAVISAGVKSILDIPRTLEYLETQGVCVAAYRTNEFPAFFTETSGCKVPCRVDTPEDCAQLIGKLQINLSFFLVIIYANLKLELGGGILIAVPIPKEHSASGSLIESAIQRALDEARDKNIIGNDATPFLLKRVNELTGGASLASNIALVKNNALVGAKVAVALAKTRERENKGGAESAL
ncbi:pseudouridine-metabolizing bifunctional protein C1861.05-like [Pyrus ussuriensis x Pyrus communis]|uniref:Pseudouridine-metabolizing bifunctional protein C1861.05-like n=1 Tax=Pyrus ussuriensis x Pyrus communis TaxID=2448454 RepID=A0A5N5FXX7_9ROSA|nr:pseudouridine-metabolizing bifunctional protein C1861.05-like [Pyrus ussuriensis x Pyrus communis]